MNAPPRRVVLVGRVSRGERKQDPESQLLPLRAAAARLGWVVVAEVSRKLSAWDDASAAKVRAEAMAPILDGRADTLAVWALDRITRRGIRDALGLVDELERHHGAALYSLQEPFLSTATAAPEFRELLISLMAWMAKQESDRKSERLKATYQRKTARAEQIGQAARWGRGHVPTALEVATVRRMRADASLPGKARTVRGIAAALVLSKSAVGRILSEGNAS